jgi:subtilisin family serine protease
VAAPPAAHWGNRMDTANAQVASRRRRRSGITRAGVVLAALIALGGLPVAGAVADGPGQGHGHAQERDGHRGHDRDAGDAVESGAAVAGTATTPAPQAATAGTSTPQATAASVVALRVAPAPPVVRSQLRATYVPTTLLVRFRPGVGRIRAEAVLARLGAHTERQIGRLGVRVVVVAPSHREAVVAALKRSRLVTSVDRDEVFHIMGSVAGTPVLPEQWGLQLADFVSAWQRTRGSSSLVVAVLDTGVNASQPGLAGAVLPGVDLVSGGSNTSDGNGHGTAVAGVIAGRPPGGVAGIGVCSACSILPVKVLGADGSGDLAAVATGIVRAADLGARVINLSLGGPLGLDVLQQAVDYATAKGAIVVAAAGNSGLTAPFYPAGYANVLSVAGTDQADHLYSWSDYGSWVRVTAPGCNVAPLVAGGYGEFCGTSSATPLVSGLAALALSVSPQGTNGQIADAIQSTARHIQANVQFGRIDASGTLTALGAPAVPAVPVAGTRISLTGTLSRAARTRAYTRTVGGGLRAVLRFRSGARLSLLVLDPAGDRVGAVTGLSPVRLGAQRLNGSLRFVVTGSVRTKISYTLTLSYARP